MKAWFPAAFASLFSLAASAQTDANVLSTEDAERLLRKYRQSNPTPLPSDSTVWLNGHWRPNKPGVYRLPQDGMPCIVPDTGKTVSIPNAWKGKAKTPYVPKPPRMPNLIKPDFLSFQSK